MLRKIRGYIYDKAKKSHREPGQALENVKYSNKNITNHKNNLY